MDGNSLNMQIVSSLRLMCVDELNLSVNGQLVLRELSSSKDECATWLKGAAQISYLICAKGIG
jgi:hypothetical protein